MMTGASPRPPCSSSPADPDSPAASRPSPRKPVPGPESGFPLRGGESPGNRPASNRSTSWPPHPADTRLPVAPRTLAGSGSLSPAHRSSTPRPPGRRQIGSPCSSGSKPSDGPPNRPGIPCKHTAHRPPWPALRSARTSRGPTRPLAGTCRGSSRNTACRSTSPRPTGPAAQTPSCAARSASASGRTYLDGWGPPSMNSMMQALAFAG